MAARIPIIATRVLKITLVKPAAGRERIRMVIPPSGFSIGLSWPGLKGFSTNGRWRPMIGGILGSRGLGMAYSSARNVVSLPDFRNFGVLIRALVLAEVINVLILLANAGSVADAWLRFGQWAPFFETTLLLILAALAMLQPLLARLAYPRGVAAVMVLAVGLALAVADGIGGWLGRPAADGLQVALLAASLAGALLGYFNWRHRALSPALGEARLAALEARIRPHFLFNSLNTVVALVRDDPGTAERVLMDLSELFRARSEEHTSEL